MVSDFRKYFIELEKKISSVESDGNGISCAELLEVYQAISGKFEEHYRRATKDLSYVFSGNNDVQFQTTETVKLLNSFDDSDDSISTTAIMAVAMDEFGIMADADEALVLPLLMSSILAEIKSDLPYHSNLHFRKVLLHSIRMIVAHNEIYADTGNLLDKQQMAALMLSAAIHDLRHEGWGNIVNHKYHMASIEKRSFSLARPYLSAAGASDPMLRDVLVMLIGTDASPFGDPISPSNQVRRAYEYHYGSSEEEAALNLSDDLSILEARADLCLMCVMLHEADIMNSAAVNYDITREETIAISHEVGRKLATPEDTLLFFEKICTSRMLSPAARYLGSDNLDNILAQVMADYKNGNVSYI